MKLCCARLKEIPHTGFSKQHFKHLCTAIATASKQVALLKPDAGKMKETIVIDADRTEHGHCSIEGGHNLLLGEKLLLLDVPWGWWCTGEISMCTTLASTAKEDLIYQQLRVVK